MITVKKLEEWDACLEATHMLKNNGGRASAKRVIEWCKEARREGWIVWLIGSPACEEMIKAGVDVNNTKDYHGGTPLHWAAYKGCLDACRLLIEHGADVNALDTFGDTPLSDAISEDHTDVVELLEKHGGRIK